VKLCSMRPRVRRIACSYPQLPTATQHRMAHTADESAGTGAHAEMPCAPRQLEAQRRGAAAAAAADPERVAADAAARTRAVALRAQAGEEAQRMAAVALASATFTVRRAPAGPPSKQRLTRVHIDRSCQETDVHVFPVGVTGPFSGCATSACASPEACPCRNSRACCNKGSGVASQRRGSQPCAAVDRATRPRRDHQIEEKRAAADAARRAERAADAAMEAARVAALAVHDKARLHVRLGVQDGRRAITCCTTQDSMSPFGDLVLS